jgi:hypothetical protein
LGPTHRATDFSKFFSGHTPSLPRPNDLVGIKRSLSAE